MIYRIFSLFISGGGVAATDVIDDELSKLNDDERDIFHLLPKESVSGNFMKFHFSCVINKLLHFNSCTFRHSWRCGERSVV